MKCHLHLFFVEPNLFRRKKRPIFEYCGWATWECFLNLNLLFSKAQLTSDTTLKFG